MLDQALLTAVASAFVAGEPRVTLLIERATQALGTPRRWLAPLARRYADAFAGRTRPRLGDVVEFLERDRSFSRVKLKLSRARILAAGQLPQMQPAPAASQWGLPAIVTVADLAEWLSLTVGELRWFADLGAMTHRPDRLKLSHYRYHVLAKGGGRLRLLEAPKYRLKLMQRQILRQILEPIPPHPAAHGFLHGRSIKTFVAPHVGQRVVLRMDLQDFFPTINGVRIQALFRTMGYPEEVADLLGGICTTQSPHWAWADSPPGLDPRRRFDARQPYARPHLPQGAPTSPALANLCTWRIDRRLTGLAISAGATYTRYADDLAFSGDASFERGVKRFAAHAAAIVSEEGLAVNHRKTRIMRQGVRQHLAGLVANEIANVPRPEFDRLKAILTNCVSSGLESQNREGHPAFQAHLNGRVGFFEAINPDKGKRLRAIFDRIDLR